MSTTAARYRFFSGLPRTVRKAGIISAALAIVACATVTAGDQNQSLGILGTASPDTVAIVRGGNSQVGLSWSAPESGRIGDKPYKGFRLYQQKQGTEISFKRPTEILVEECTNKSDCTVGGLQNGELYVFYLKAYDSDDKEFWQTTIFGFPGTSPAGKPRTPQDCYGIAGDGRTALYWEKNLEADLLGYEVYRRGENDSEFRLIARIPKIFRIKAKSEHKDGTAANYIQGLTPPGYLDTTVANGKPHAYKVRACDAAGLCSDFTDTILLTPKPCSPPAPDEVLLIVDEGFDGSEEVAQYYAKKRNIPDNRIFRYHHNPRIKTTDYQQEIQYPLQRFLLKNKIAGKIRYLVPCYGVPIAGAGRALDSKLADLFDRYTYGLTMGTPNPYFNSRMHFDGTTGTYLVTRLDGPTVAIAKSLVDKALMAEKSVTARSGTAYFGNRNGTSIGDRSIGQAAEIGKKMGIKVITRSGEFKEHELGSDAYWYFAWYHGYRDPVKGEWPTGAVGSHLISNSFATIRGTGWSDWKSWVQGLLDKGMTATFGAVIEPYLQGYTRPDIFFDHFWSGDYNFAESFAMATPTIQWAMSAVGDPLFRLKK